MAPFYRKFIAPQHVSINDIFPNLMPFLAIIAMAMFSIFPEIGLWLPRYLYG